MIQMKMLSAHRASQRFISPERPIPTIEGLMRIGSEYRLDWKISDIEEAFLTHLSLSSLK